jgi:hypothetical protein
MPFGYCALPDDVASVELAMFAYVFDQPAQREALQEEILERIAAIQALSERWQRHNWNPPTHARTAASSMRWPTSRAMCVD